MTWEFGCCCNSECHGRVLPALTVTLVLAGQLHIEGSVDRVAPLPNLGGMELGCQEDLKLLVLATMVFLTRAAAVLTEVVEQMVTLVCFVVRQPSLVPQRLLFAIYLTEATVVLTYMLGH